MKKQVLLSWSSGKDSAWALHTLSQTPDTEVIGLFTTVNAEFGRVAMHAVRNDLLERQAEAVGLPLDKIEIPYPCNNDQYEKIMGGYLEKVVARGIRYIAYGDLYLEDIRSYRERGLKGTGIEPLFPLWGEDTKALSKLMLAAGLKAKVTCIDPKTMLRESAGGEYSESWLASLPDTIDPCGENGEFHTFTYAGPMFKQAVNVQTGETVKRDGFIFTDLLPVE